MSAFEVACWNWYQEMVNPLILAGGALGDLIRAERLRGPARGLFIRALGLIHETLERVGAEKAEAARKRG